MSQAPLVYSSKQTLGIDITLPNPETPAAELHVGFKNKDIAIVPVAVAKLPKEQFGNDNPNPILLVKATYSGSMKPEDLAAAIKGKEDAKRDLDEKSQNYKTAQENFDKLQAKKSQQSKRLAELVASLDSSSQQDAKRKDDEKEKKDIEDTQKIEQSEEARLSTVLEISKSAKERADNLFKEASKRVE